MLINRLWVKSPAALLRGSSLNKAHEQYKVGAGILMNDFKELVE
jgi:hypothetical protein